MSDNNPMTNTPFDRRDPRQYPCSDHEKRVSMMEKSVTAVERTMDAVSTKLDLILAQITKVAILEEKHSNLILDTDRAHKKIEDLSDKLDKLSEETRAFINYTRGQNKVLWAIGAGFIVLLVKVLFFSAQHGMAP